MYPDYAKADADEFIQSFPKGYDTLIGDIGEQLSGGQRLIITVDCRVINSTIQSPNQH
jgi:ABC-type protease/lipase transport system fused ATPase/permease subunit